MGVLITKLNADTMRANHRFSQADIANQGVRGFRFTKQELTDLLNTDGCEEVIIYFGLTNNVPTELQGRYADTVTSPYPQVIVYPIDANNKLIDVDVLSMAKPCPKICPQLPNE